MFTTSKPPPGIYHRALGSFHVWLAFLGSSLKQRLPTVSLLPTSKQSHLLLIFIVRLVGAQVVISQPNLLPSPLLVSQLIPPQCSLAHQERTLGWLSPGEGKRQTRVVVEIMRALEGSRSWRLE